MGTPRRGRPAVTAPGRAGATHPGDHTAPAPDMVWVCRSATLPRAAYRFYRDVLLRFAQGGGPPERAALRRLAQRFDVGLEDMLARLAAQDLVQRDPASGAITAAYPFSGVPTPHRVALVPARADTPPTEVYAMCALDALGIPLMLGREAAITSADPLTGEVVRVHLRRAEAESVSQSAEAGLPGWHVAWEPAMVVVYARPEDDACDDGAMAALCRCPVTTSSPRRPRPGGGLPATVPPGDVALTASPGPAARASASAAFSTALPADD